MVKNNFSASYFKLAFPLLPHNPGDLCVQD